VTVLSRNIVSIHRSVTECSPEGSVNKKAYEALYRNGNMIELGAYISAKFVKLVKRIDVYSL
jgi:hypothetical protein